MATSRISVKGHFDGCATQFRVSTCRHEEALGELDAYATVCIDTGAASLQTYLTAEECRQLAVMLNDAAVQVSVLSLEAA